MYNKTKNIASFKIEVNCSLKENDIISYFKSINILRIEFKDKIEENNSNLYECFYELTEDNLVAIDSLKNNLSKSIQKSKISFKNLDAVNVFGNVLNELILKEKASKECYYRVDYSQYSKFNYVKDFNSTGLELIDKESINRSSKVINFMIKSLGKNFFSGKELTNTSLPIFINDERSLVELYLVPACNATLLEKIKLITTYFISILNQTLYLYKPFNPIIGETFQCLLKDPRNKDNEEIMFYAEQTSHHPPICNFYATHKLFKVYGHRYAKPSTSGGNSIYANMGGEYIIEFNDKSKVTLKYGNFVINGIIIGNKSVNYTGNFIIEDKVNKIKSIFKVNPQEKKSGILNKIFGKRKNYFPDYFKGFIAYTDDIKYDKNQDSYECNDELILSKYEGEYNSYLNIDNNKCWDIDDNCDKNSALMLKDKFVLESDCRLRSDILLYKQKIFDLAQYAKMILEDTQRNDAKLRKSQKN